MDSEVKRQSVDWDTLMGGGEVLHLQNPGPRPGPLSSVLAAIDELSAYSDKDVVLRRAVELARDKLQLERVAIFLLDAAEGQMVGTFGTGIRGETTDERDFTYRHGGLDRDVHEQAKSGTSRWLLMQDAPYIAKVGDDPVVIGRGWIAVTAIRTPTRAVGVMFNDAALSGRPMSEGQQTRVAVFCSLLGPVISRLDDPALGLPSISTNDASKGARSFVERIILALRDDPSLDAKLLASRLDVTEGHLNRRFRKATGLSLVDYRNRLRVERFLQFVEGGSESLQRAAELAGFGSYAQFHRVFRATLGTSPREYLTGQRVGHAADQ